MKSVKVLVPEAEIICNAATKTRMEMVFGPSDISIKIFLDRIEFLKC